MIKRYWIRGLGVYRGVKAVESEQGEWMRAADVLPELERLRAKVRQWEDIEFAPGRVVAG